jgi:hypothetical protein
VILIPYTLLACTGPTGITLPTDTPSTQDTATTSLTIEGVTGPNLNLSHTRGFYDTPFTLDLWSDADNAQVWFSTDGTNPQNGDPWSGPTEIAGTVTLSAVVILDGQVVSDPVTHTFLFLDQVADQQAPSSWPTTWWGSYAADYSMDPELVDADLVPALQALPTLSLVVGPWDLWGNSGIYENPEAEGSNWEVPVSMEWLQADGQNWQVNAGLRIMGGASRSPANSPKKALRLLFKADYGPTSLKEFTLPEQSIDTWDTLVLRARYNQSWIHWDTTQRLRAQYIRDQFARSTQQALGQPGVSGRFVHLYLDGLYWGLYNIHPRPQASFLARIYGGEDTDYDVLNSGEAVDGDTSAWQELHQLLDRGVSTDDALEAIEAAVELDNLIDYMLLNFYLGNDDWPSHNWYAGRHRDGGVGWVFFAWDSEHTLKDLSTNVLDADYSGSPARIYQKLRSHPDFDARVSARAHELFDDGGPLSADACLARYEALAVIVAPAVQAESVRWGDYRRDVHSYSNGPYELYTVPEFWDLEYQRLTQDYLPYRSQEVMDQLRREGLY